MSGKCPWGKSGGACRNKKTIIATAFAPNAIGPYSQAIKANGFLFVSGCIGLDPETGKMVPGGVKEQTAQVLKNLTEIVKAGDCEIKDVVKTTVLLTDMKDYGVVNTIYSDTFMEGKPARAAFAVKGLPAGALVEIDAVVVVSGKSTK